ncbi:MAG: efflux RND transporter periplasmic adaptor subunit, partial [Chloroflexi bacterium]|nr:efflux RND transporter periplasmic adaptor subunit [Chloroflexota bacterium]
EKPTYTVKRGEVVDSLSFTGRVAPVIEEELWFRQDGRVKKVYVERNDMVEAGQLLAELENDDLVRQLQQAEIELETAELNLKKSLDAQQFAVDKAEIDLTIKKLNLAKTENSLNSLTLDAEIARANLAKAKKGPSAEDIAIAQRRIEQAKNNLWAAQVSRDATCGQNKNSADCDRAQANVQSAEEGVRIAELNLQKDLKGPAPEDIAILEANLQKILQKIEDTKTDIEIQKRQIELAEMELAKLKEEGDTQLSKAVERAKLSVERLQSQVEATRIESPIAGKVTSVSAYEGRTVNAYKPVFIVADESELEITAEPMSSQLQRLTEGMKASIVLSAYPGKELPGEIIQLPYPYGSGGASAAVSAEAQDKLTHISFDPQDLDIEPGDLVKVIVTIERKADALWLPPAAIRTFAGRQFVVVQDADGRQRRVDITVGIESAERVEIESGLNEGDVVIGQ